MSIAPSDLLATPARMMAVVITVSALLAGLAMLVVIGPARILPRAVTRDMAADRRRCDALLVMIDAAYSSRRPRIELVRAIEDETDAMRLVDGYDGSGADPGDPLQTCTRPPRMDTRS